MLVEGIRAVNAALAAGAPVRDVLVTHHATELDLTRLPQGAAVYRVTEDEMARLSDVETSQGLLAVVAIELCHEEDLRGSRRILLLDGIRDPGNAGTLVRTAAWFGVDAVVSGAGTVDLYNPKVVRAAMGGLWDVRHARATDPGTLLSDLRAHGFAVYGADLAGRPVSEWRPEARSVLVLGSEAHGLSPTVREQVDQLVFIPGGPDRGGTESLNVAVAGGILAYEWMHRGGGRD